MEKPALFSGEGGFIYRRTLLAPQHQKHQWNGDADAADSQITRDQASLHQNEAGNAHRQREKGAYEPKQFSGREMKQAGNHNCCAVEQQQDCRRCRDHKHEEVDEEPKQGVRLVRTAQMNGDHGDTGQEKDDQ